MNTDTLATPLSYVQLLTKLRESYVEIKKALINMKSARDPNQKINSLASALHFPVVAASAAIKIEAKSVEESLTIAKTYTNSFARSPIYDERQIDAFIVPAYDKILQTLKDAKRHAEAELLKSKALIRLLRVTRVNVWREKKNALKYARKKLKASQRQAPVGQIQEAA